MSDQPPGTDIPTDTPRAIGALLAIALPVGAGVALAYLLLSTFIIPRVGFPGDLNRILKLDERLEIAREQARAEGIDDQHRVVIVSHSVGVEGIIAQDIEDQLPAGYAVENQSSNGLDLLSGRVYIGRVLESNPGTLVWILRPEMMGELLPINDELASAFRFGGFQNNADWVNTETIPGLDASTRSRFNSSGIKNQASLRTLPLRHLNEQVRTRTRKGILPAKPLELNAPYQMDTGIEGQRLRRHLDDMVSILEKRTENENRDGIAFIDATIAQIRATSTIPVLVIAPTHPMDEEGFGPMEKMFNAHIQEIADRYGIVLIDLTGTLTAEHYADAIHPNRDGAKVLSTRLGEAINRKMLDTAGGDD